ncbi:MAG: hypothetical protein KDD33_06135 [Bdellovibrionales bacterium]|nr:hypothetical protein [Bdellovibrionales bacterium]
MSKKRLVVICPGRGSYTKETLGYLQNRKEIQEPLKIVDQMRTDLGEPTISDLDSAKTFKVSVHTKGEHASPLIFCCALADFLSIDPDQYEIVAITGNSMGWYLALAFSGALNLKDSFRLIQTMGSMMKDSLIGGQIIYPVVDKHWIKQKERVDFVHRKVDEINNDTGCEAYVSIYLGGYMVLAGNSQGLQRLLKELPPIEHYPFQLINHGAFHTPMLQSVSEKAFVSLEPDLFQKPKIPLVDGRGMIWQPYSSDPALLRNYTLGHQVVAPYDFSASVRVALKEFSPDHLVLLGPGNSLGGSIGQILIENQWRFIESKEMFSHQQKTDPFLISMGLAEQRVRLTKEHPSQNATTSISR